MATEDVEDWDAPLPEPEEEEVDPEDQTEPETEDEKELKRNTEKLKKYVERMVYFPEPPPIKMENERSDPKKTTYKDNYEQFKTVLVPKQRAQRMHRHVSKVAPLTAITTEQLELIIKQQKTKEKKKEDLLRRKQELYYEMLTKLERQCRTQYLNVLIKKFANFIAKLATTMRIPPQLVEPYARMQRGIFCNILLAIGVQPTNQSSIYYASQEALEYEVCHKLAHALLSLIIKALDSAATKKPEDVQPSEVNFEMDNYIKDRLMCAAEKKIINERSMHSKFMTTHTIKPMPSSAKKCDYFSANNMNYK